MLWGWEVGGNGRNRLGILFVCVCYYSNAWHKQWQLSSGQLRASTVMCPLEPFSFVHLMCANLGSSFVHVNVNIAFMVYCVSIIFMWSKLLVFSIRYLIGIKNMKGEHYRHQILHRQARELVYKVFSYFKCEAGVICICLSATCFFSCLSV
jgi:hypothetical protein